MFSLSFKTLRKNIGPWEKWKQWNKLDENHMKFECNLMLNRSVWRELKSSWNLLRLSRQNMWVSEEKQPRKNLLTKQTSSRRKHRRIERSNSRVSRASWKKFSISCFHSFAWRSRNFQNGCRREKRRKYKYF